MNAILFGGGIGTIGLLVGAVLYLRMQGKYEKVKGQLAMALEKLKQEEREHRNTLENAERDADLYLADAARKEELINAYKIRLEKLREREIESADFATLLSIANEQPGVPVVVSDAEDTRPNRQDGDGAGTVSDGGAP